MCLFPERRIGPYKSALPHKAEVSRRKVCFWGRSGRQCRRLEPPLVANTRHTAFKVWMESGEMGPTSAWVLIMSAILDLTAAASDDDTVH